MTKEYLEPPPPTLPPTTSGFSTMYFDTPTNDDFDTPIDKIDDHIEVFELTFPQNETSSIEVEMVPYEDPGNEILKDFYVGDSTRRPNSYFYNELQDEEMDASVNYQHKETTPIPDFKDPLPTYKTYTDHYPSSTISPPSSSTSPTTSTTITYFPSSEATRRPSFTTFAPYFQHSPVKSRPTSSTIILGTTPSIRFSTPQTTTYDPHSFSKDVIEKKVDKIQSVSKVG